MTSIYQEQSDLTADSNSNQSAANLTFNKRWISPFRKLSNKNVSRNFTSSSKLSNDTTLLAVPNSLHIKHHSCSNSSSRKSSYSSSIIETPLPRSNPPARSTPVPGARSSSALSNLSFRSLRSINSRIKVRIQSIGQLSESRSPKQELGWSSFRSEYELHLARGSIIERCLVEVDLGPTVTERGRLWIDSVWTLADRLSPPLPAALAQYSAAGLLPLLNPLRHTLHDLALALPYIHTEEEDFEKFDSLVIILRRAIWLAKLIENVIEIVSQVGLIKFELIGPSNGSSSNPDLMDWNEFTDGQKHIDQYLDSIKLISEWSGEMKGRTGSGQHWRGSIKVS